MVSFELEKQKNITMRKNNHFTGHPILNQLTNFIDKGAVRRIAREHNAERYVKKFDTYNHLVVMLFSTFSGYHSIREVILGLLANAHKLYHLGLNYIVKRSTFSEANRRRSSDVFRDIYLHIFNQHKKDLADSRLNSKEMKRLYIMDSTTITLFKEILKGTGRNPKNGKRKGGIKAHTIIKASENVPILVRYSAAAKHDHNFLNEIHHLPKDSIITFDKGYVDYAQYQKLTENSIWYVTRLKMDAVYNPEKELDIPDDADNGVLKDEIITLTYKEGNELKKHKARRIAYWDDENNRLFEFLTNNMVLSAEMVALIYKKRWQIELLFKQLKQNFPLKYFLGDNENAIKIQIWAALIANLLLTLVRSKLKRKWAFSNMVSVIRQQLMSYINLYQFLEDPEATWRRVLKENKVRYKDSLFPEFERTYF